MAQSYEFFTALRDFHVYSNAVNWRPYVGQNITFKRKQNNPHDRFAVAGKTMLKGKIAPVTVGHVPRELGRSVWYAIMEGAKFEAVVHQEDEKPSPLVQEIIIEIIINYKLLKIIIKMKSTWDSQEKLTILSAKVAEIAYPVDDDYKDDSNEILKMLQVEEDDDDDEEEAEENFGDDDDDDDDE